MLKKYPYAQTKKSTLWKITVVGVIVLVLLCLLVLLVATQIAVRLQRTLNTTAVPNYDAKTLYTTALEQINKGDYKQAEAYLQKAESQQHSSDYVNQLAIVEYRLKKYDQSIAEYQKLISSNQDPGFAWNGIGNVYRDWALESPANTAAYQAQALQAYQKAIAVNPHYVAAYSNQALLLQTQGQTSAAFDILNAGINATGSPELSQTKNNISQIKQ